MNLTFASNQGEVSGGEVMLLAMAAAARGAGHDVRIVVPATPDTLVREARRGGFTVTAIPGENARAYLRNLRRWDAREREGLLWCNGLRPAFATAGHRDRVVHLHQIPAGRQLRLAARIARRGARAVIVPSRFAQRGVPGSEVLLNWTADEPAPHRPRQRAEGDARHVVGYLGRLSVDKGLTTLCAAVTTLRQRGLDVRLLVAGEHRFVPDDQVRAVEQALDALGPHVERRGWMPRDVFFAAVDVAAFPSQWDEVFGLVAAEAMAARCPFVVSDAGGLPEVVGADYPLMFRAGDADALTDVLDRALSQPLTPVVEAAHERWSERFGPQAGGARFLHLLDTLTGAAA